MTTPTNPLSATEIISKIIDIEWKKIESPDPKPTFSSLNDIFPIDNSLLKDREEEIFYNMRRITDTHTQTNEKPANRYYHSSPLWMTVDLFMLTDIEHFQLIKTPDSALDIIPDTKTPEKIAEIVEDIHNAWQLALQIDESIAHPLAGIIHAWLKDQLPKVEPERRKDTGILHHNMRDTFPSPRLKLTKIESSPAESKQMQFINDLPHGDLQLELPGFVFPETELVPALPLIAYENAEGKPPVGGRGAPISQRLFINVLVEYEQEKRGLYSISRLNATYRDIKSWLYPNGTKESRKKLIPRLYEGMWHLHNFRFIWERREWNIISVDSLPTMDIKPDDRLTFTIRMPDGLNTGNGALIGIEPLREYGAQSAPKFRAWVRLAYLWDAAKVKNGGKRIYATIPEVLRNSDGYLMDAKGEVLLTGDPYSTQGGWKFRNGQMPQTAWYHPLAIHTGRQIRNPQADKVPVLSRSDMVKLFYDHTQRTENAFRKDLSEAIRFAREMQDEGRIVIEDDQIHTKTGEKGWRILEPYGEIVSS